MATNKQINSRLQLKHDTEANWITAGENGFIPLVGEVIVYDKDKNHKSSRIKIGDGTTNVNELAFTTEVDWSAKQGEAGYVQNRTHYMTPSTVIKRQTVSFNSGASGFGNFKQGAADIETFFIAGQVYKVDWNGIEYTCVGREVSELYGEPCTVVVGNINAILGGESTNEPFIIGTSARGDRALVVSLDGSTSAVVTCKAENIHFLDGKYLPKGVPYSEGGKPTNEIIFNGDIQNYYYVQSSNDGVTYYFVKVSDIVPHPLFLLGGKMKIGAPNDDLLDTEEYEINYDSFIEMSESILAIGECILLVMADCEFEGVNLTKGIYFLYIPEMAWVKELKINYEALIPIERIHKLDKKYLDLGYIWEPVVNNGSNTFICTTIDDFYLDGLYYGYANFSFDQLNLTYNEAKPLKVVVNGIEYDAVGLSDADAKSINVDNDRYMIINAGSGMSIFISKEKYKEYTVTIYDPEDNNIATLPEIFLPNYLKEANVPVLLENFFQSKKSELTGATGPRGLTGATGSTGPIGPQGATGATGPQGEQGATGLTGSTGPQGLQGATGATGPKGDRGEPFTVNKVYASVAAMNAGYSTDGVPVGGFVVIDTGNVNNVDNAKLYIKGNSSYTFLTDLSGAQGIQGPVGATGATGPKGDSITGPTGATGPQGKQGATGSTGPQGVQGATGPKGDSITGPTGATGATGPQGPVGATGPQGVQGATGITGATGSKGNQGATGATGPQGPKGDSVTGPKGATGATGPQGATGPAGPTTREKTLEVLGNGNASLLQLPSTKLLNESTLKLESYGTRFLTINGNNLTFDVSADTGGWAISMADIIAGNGAAKATTIMLGAYGGPSGLNWIYMGGTYDSPWFKIDSSGKAYFKERPCVGSEPVATTTGANTFTGNNVFTNNQFAIRASGANDDSWIMLTNNAHSGYYAFGIRRPYTSYGLQLKYHPDPADTNRPGEGTADIYYDIYHQGNYTKIPVATASLPGLMSATDKGKVDSLGSAAYTASSAYATAAQGTKADNALPKSGGTLTGPVVFANTSGNNRSSSYISAGGGYSVNSGRLGLKLLALDQGDAQMGLGVDLCGGPYELTVATSRKVNNQSSKIVFATHTSETTEYHQLGYFLQSGSTTLFQVNGKSIIDSSVTIGGSSGVTLEYDSSSKCLNFNFA